MPLPLPVSAPAPANWFGDPFVQVSAAVAGCPEPLGPRITQGERLAQSHHRAERGTTCFLQGQCSEPNAYRYDIDIARAVVQALRQSPRVAQGTLWVTVQGRDVFIEGCAPAAQATADEAEGLARQVPQVLQAVAAVFDGHGPAPYRTWPNRPTDGPHRDRPPRSNPVDSPSAPWHQALMRVRWMRGALPWPSSTPATTRSSTPTPALTNKASG